MLSNSYIGRSGQAWKVWLGAFFLLIGFLMIMLVFIPAVRVLESIRMALLLGGIVFSALSLLWVCLAVRCKKCRTRLVWRAMKEQSHQKWLSYLLTSKECPYCDKAPENNN